MKASFTSLNEPGSIPQHRSTRRLLVRHPMAWAFIVLALLALFARRLGPDLYVFAAAFTLFPIVRGSRIQRIVAVTLLLAAVIGFVRYQFLTAQRRTDRERTFQEHYQRK